MSLLEPPPRFRHLSAALVEPNDATFLPVSIILDHVVIASALEDEVGGNVVEVIHLDSTIGDYQNTVSDHRPLASRLAFGP